MSTSEPFNIHISTADARRDQQDIVRVSAVYTIARDDYLTSINHLTAALTNRFDDLMRERSDLAAKVGRLRAENDALRNSINRALNLSTPITRDALLGALADPEPEDGEVQP